MENIDKYNRLCLKKTSNIERFEQRDGCIRAANGHVWNSMRFIPSGESNVGANQYKRINLFKAQLRLLTIST